MNNKGSITGLEYTIGIIFSAIVIILWLNSEALGGFFNPSDNELKQAENSLEKITAGMNIAKQVGQRSVDIYTPSDWYISSWPGKDYRRPNDCGHDKYCVCICEGYNIEDCNTLGACSEFEESIYISEKDSSYSIVDSEWSTLIESEWLSDSFIEITNPPILLNINYKRGYQIVRQDE